MKLYYYFRITEVWKLNWRVQTLRRIEWKLWKLAVKKYRKSYIMICEILKVTLMSN